VTRYIEKHYRKDMEVEELIVLGLRALRAALEEPLTVERVEVGYISAEEKVFRKLTAEETMKYLEKAGVTT